MTVILLFMPRSLKASEAGITGCLFIAYTDIKDRDYGWQYYVYTTQIPNDFLATPAHNGHPSFHDLHFVQLQVQ